MSVLERVREQEVQVQPSPGMTASEARARLKRELVDRLGLTTVAAMAEGANTHRARAEIAVACEALLNAGGYGPSDVQGRATIISEVLDEVLGLGPLQPLLDDPTITEIMVNGCRELFFERDGEIFAAERVFESSEQIMLVIDKILAPLGRRLDKASPIVNARLKNGDRVNAVAEPIAIDGPVVTIRRFSKHMVTLERLVELGSLPAWYACLLEWAVLAREDIAVAGGTGSGKTTLLNALSAKIGPGERIVTIEDAAELKFESHPNVVRLEARDASIEGTGEVSIRDLVKNALRMRPDRIVVGEVRGAEAIDMIQAINTGHDGSLTSLHAGTPEEAVLRLVLMSRFGMDLPTELIAEQIASGLDLIVMSRRMADGKRYLSSLCAVSRRESGGVDLDECVRFDEGSRTWELVREPAFVGRALAEGVLDGEEVRRWRQLCS